MNNKLIVGGIVAALLMMSMPVNAYHITGIRNPVPTNQSAHNWDFTTILLSPIDEPCVPGSPLNALWLALWTALYALPTIGPILFFLFGPDPAPCIFAPPLTVGSILFGLILCESDDWPLGLSGLGVPGISKHGNGGLCFMSPGYLEFPVTVPCTFIGLGFPGIQPSGDLGQWGGRSDGYGPEYDAVANPSGATCEKRHTLDGVPADPLLASVVAGPDYYTYEMTDGPCTPYLSSFPALTAWWADPSATCAAAGRAVGGQGSGGLAPALEGSWIPFEAQVGGIPCGMINHLTTVDMVWAYAFGNGHVAGFPEFGPSIPDHVLVGGPSLGSPPQPIGTYNVEEGFGAQLPGPAPCPVAAFMGFHGP